MKKLLSILVCLICLAHFPTYSSDDINSEINKIDSVVVVLDGELMIVNSKDAEDVWLCTFCVNWQCKDHYYEEPYKCLKNVMD